MKATIHAVLVVFGIILVLIAATRTWRSLETTQANKAKTEKLLAQNKALQRQLPDQNQTTAQNPQKTAPNQNTHAAYKSIEDYNAGVALLNERLKKDPETQKRFFAAKRVDIRTAYGPFFRLAGLSPEQTEKFTDALLARAETLADLAALKTSGEYDPNDPVWKALEEEADLTRDAAAREILGDDGYAQFQTFNHESQAWSYASHMAVNITLAGMPVTPEQTQQLKQAIIAATPVDPSNNALLYENTDWDSVDGEARKILTPEQARVFSAASFSGGVGLRWGQQFWDAMSAATKAEAAKSPTP